MNKYVDGAVKMVLRRTKKGKTPQNVGTPQYIIDALLPEFPFDLDVAADAYNAKCELYLDEKANGLQQTWSVGSRRLPDGTWIPCDTWAWCNPPYNDIEAWVAKAYEESFKGVTTVMLLPVRTDRPWFQEYWDKAEIRFIKGRIKFVAPPGWKGVFDPETGKTSKWSSSAFPCLLMIFHAWPQNASETKRAGIMSCVEFKEEEELQ